MTKPQPLQTLAVPPTTLEGGRVVDAYGCASGSDSQTPDAIQAFCQAPMLSKVWVTLPAEAIFDPDFYWLVNDLVVLLALALYGYPDSPTFWENHCDNQVLMTGWSKLGPEWDFDVLASGTTIAFVNIRRRLQDGRTQGKLSQRMGTPQTRH